MTLLRIRVGTIDTDKAKALLYHLEDVVASPRTRGMVEGRTVVVDVDERDIPAVKQVLAYHHDWIASFQ